MKALESVCMGTGELPGAAPRQAATRRAHRLSLLRGGTDGNEQLTAITGMTLIVLLAVIGVTILRIGQLISVHLFVGFLLLGPVALKMASTGYRFMRYYTRDHVYREKGPPTPVLRAIAPVVVATTLVVFVSGIVLMFRGPAHRSALLLIHKASFIMWLAFTSLHVLAHVPRLTSSFRGFGSSDDRVGVPGSAGRWIALASALAAGLVLAIVLIPHYSSWTAAGSFGHDH